MKSAGSTFQTLCLVGEDVTSMLFCIYKKWIKCFFLD
ncbi:MAG: hypothetical protein BTN85_0121 [Candidatus Methanohalarchaeum thermophilum]|uniref:Uncharacterized protein n=1 Tax=Methanohalarchaeum thermophilum TaxID=1903181 RepID=A0A1Q6DTI2_METT1|nr:MAG: hypothetical protein BTN85_0121 [Candidatus Methanohalarchaeum thermophilum]